MKQSDSVDKSRNKVKTDGLIYSLHSEKADIFSSVKL